MPFAAEAITLIIKERSGLEQITQSRTLPAGDVFRVRLILMLADSVSYRTIPERLDTIAATIWRQNERLMGSVWLVCLRSDTRAKSPR